MNWPGSALVGRGDGVAVVGIVFALSKFFEVRGWRVAEHRRVWYADLEYFRLDGTLEIVEQPEVLLE